MIFKRIEDFSITDCCLLLNLCAQDLEKSKLDLYSLSAKIRASSENEVNIKKQFLRLLESDRRDFQNCVAEEDYAAYRSKWPDGLWRRESIEMQDKLRAEELNLYNECKSFIGSTDYCYAYLQKYPKGRYVSKVKRRRLFMIFAKFVGFILLILIYVGLWVIFCS